MIEHPKLHSTINSTSATSNSDKKGLPSQLSDAPEEALTLCCIHMHSLA